ncbi:MAG: glycosyltransferase family 2 protein [Prevotella sp.]|nr:glycosyltransferase family 2 protein [Prevotella sp.]
MNIAAILTVFNRKEKTLKCLHYLFDAVHSYNKDTESKINLTVYLTDDGSTDGTKDAINMEFPQNGIHIIEGTGSLFWAGGMRLAWQTAIDSKRQWDYFLLLNDDTIVYANVFAELFNADEYILKETGRHGLSSGITCQPGNPQEITYGGFSFANNTKGRLVMAMPTGEPHVIDLTHANILLVHHTVSDCIGIFPNGFLHRCADWDYSMTAKRHGYLTMVTANVCGECENDHDSSKDEISKLRKMTLSERKEYINAPTRCNHDYLLYVRRNLPLRFPIAYILRNLRIYFPSLYYHISNLRGVYKK